MTVRLDLKVVAGAARSEIAGWLGRRIKVRVAAAPERGKANAAVRALLAARLDLPRSAVRIVAGHGRPDKRVEIDELGPDEILARLGLAAPPSRSV